MPEANRHRVLVISRDIQVRHDLTTLLSGYGYYVESSGTRQDGVHSFRAHKQSIVILDVPTLREFPRRLFLFFQRVRRNTIVLIAASKAEEATAVERLALGAYDVLILPLKTDFLKLTLSRAIAHHRLSLENIFIKNMVFFALLFLPIWGFLAYLLMR
jgi:DNA-binding NtrC family response regulator